MRSVPGNLHAEFHAFTMSSGTVQKIGFLDSLLFVWPTQSSI